MFKIPEASAKKIISYSINAFLLIAIIGLVFYFGYFIGNQNSKKIVVENITNTENPAKLTSDFGVFWEAWDLLKKEHIKGTTTPDQKYIYGAVDGLVNSIGDPNTNFFPPEDSKKFEEDVSGNFGGIGAEIGIKNNQLIVVAPMKNTPAEKIGLKAGDRILAINGKSTQEVDVNDAVKKIRGEIGTVVTLTISRNGWEKTQDFKITRANIEIPTGELDILTAKDVKISDIKLFSFNQNAPEIFHKAVSKTLEEKADGIILDLRNNPGGFLEVATNIAGWFFEKGTIIVKEKPRNGQETVFKANGNGLLKDIPIVVLVNKGSASASEILAGALNVIRGAKLIGTDTYGKGTVQELRSLSDGSKIKITIANWILPNGIIISEDGIKADIKVDISEENLKKMEGATDEQKAQLDSQLQKAIEVLTKEIKQKK